MRERGDKSRQSKNMGETPMPRDLVPDRQFVRSPDRFADFSRLGRVCRLGLASRGNTHLAIDAIMMAVGRGINYLNWCGRPDDMSRAIRQLGPDRRDVFVAVQLSARSASAARRELDEYRQELGRTHIDVVTYYYVEHIQEWKQIIGPQGAAEVLDDERARGKIGVIGMTSHQRQLAARIICGGRLDMLMIRYNAAHRGAEEDVFAHTMPRNMPVVTFTGLRWGALMNATPDDPPHFPPPPVPMWYRFVLCHPAVTVALMAPNDEDELEQNLTLLDEWKGLTDSDYESLRAHGERVYRHAGRFP